MIAGHFGFAAGAKSAQPAAPLWALMLGTMWLDVVFAPLYALGVETIDVPAGGGYGDAVIHADYTHSLVGAALLSVVFGLFFLRRGRAVAVVLAVVAFSHWVLDLVVHRPDLPLLPGDIGDLPELGFGLWRVPAASIALEALLVLAGGWLYWRTARRHASPPRPGDRVTPNVVTAVIIGSGLLVLLLDAVGA